MTSGARMVDLGPMSLPVGEERPLPPAAASSAETGRFEALMAAERSSRRRRSRDEAGWQADEDTGGSAGRDEADDAEAVDAAIERIWVAVERQGRREVRVGAANHVLPGMTLAMLQEAGRLELQVRATAMASPAWLLPRVPALARDLSERLGRRVAVSAYEADGGLAARACWPADPGTEGAA